MSYNKYTTTISEADEANFQFLVEFFKDSDKFKVIRPANPSSPFDGFVVTKKDGKDICILAEVKIRSISSNGIRDVWHSTIYLEKLKYKNMHLAAKKYATQGREVKLWYITVTSDDCVYIHDITDRDYQWVSNQMNNKTKVANPEKTSKKIALLHTSDVIFAKKIK